MKGIESKLWVSAQAVFFTCLLLVAMFSACEETRDPIARDPSVNIMFLNKDSLDKVNVIASSLEEELLTNDSQLAELNASSTLLADSLIKLTDLIAEGEDLDAERAQVINDLDTLESFIRGIEEADSTLNVRYNEWLAVISTIESGSVEVLSIENLNNNQMVTYGDSSVNWFLPLDMNADEIDVNINIEDQLYRFGLKYSRWTNIDEFGNVKIRAADFEIISSDFDSTYVSCIDCIDSETSLYVEF